MGKSRDMGLKRWLLAFVVFVLIVGLLVGVFFQTSADERIVATVMPGLEKRLGVSIEYERVDVSVTAVSFKGITVSPQSGDAPFARVERLGVAVRVGPLLLGDLDVTGLRLDGLELRAGEAAGGADVEQWRELMGRLRDDPPATGSGHSSPSRRPEINLVSGQLFFEQEGLSVAVHDLSGRVAGDGSAVVRFGRFDIVHGERRLVEGGGGELRHQPGQRRLGLRLQGPRFELPADREIAVQVARGMRELLAAGDGVASADGGATGTGGAEDGAQLPVEGWQVAITEASVEIVDQGEPDHKLALRAVELDVASTEQGGISLRGSGLAPGTDTRWVLGLTVPRAGEPRLTLEVPDLPLARVGRLLGNEDVVDWGRAALEGSISASLARDRSIIELNGQLALSGLGLRQERLAAVRLEDVGGQLDFKITYDRPAGRVALERLAIARERSRATIRGAVELDRMAFDLRLNLPTTSCRAVLGAFPRELRPRLEGLVLDGYMGLELRLAVDEQSPESTVLEAQLDNRCRLVDTGSLPDPGSFRRPFAYTAYRPDGSPLRLVTGPGTDRWSPLSAISPFVIEALLTTEDGKFWHHDGVTLPEVRRAIELNLRRGGLVYGASTITMQLAKNLLLTRERTVARKLQELVLVWYLEQSLGKEEILELYLNVVEFGPEIYGIRQAAWHYFGREPHELNLLESVFLIKRLPNPVARHASYDRNEISERQLAMLRRVLRTMRSRKRITDSELADGLEQEIVFHQDGDPLPVPRPPVQRAAGGLEPGARDDPADAEDVSELREPVDNLE